MFEKRFRPHARAILGQFLANSHLSANLDVLALCGLKTRMAFKKSD